jgi:hypothetical protein
VWFSSFRRCWSLTMGPTPRQLRERAPPGIALTFEYERGFTFDPAAWGQGFATEAARCVRDYARDVLQLSYAVSPTRALAASLNGRARTLAGKDVIGRTCDRYVGGVRNRLHGSA